MNIVNERNAMQIDHYNNLVRDAMRWRSHGDQLIDVLRELIDFEPLTSPKMVGEFNTAIKRARAMLAKAQL